MSYEDVIAGLSEETGLSGKVVNSIYKAYWLYIKTMIQALPLKDDLTEEEFLKLHTNFNIPSLGKLHCTYGEWVGQKKRFSYIKDFRKKNGICT